VLSRIIEAAERDGQQQLIGIDVLPIEPKHLRPKLEAMGIVYGEPVDDLFVAVQLPLGWKKVATDSQFWTDLIDAEGKVVALIGYKASFYDRRAIISLVEEGG